MTLLADEIYLLREKERDQVEVYDVITYRLQRRLTVPNCRRFTDMAACEHYRCLYVAEDGVDRIHRLQVDGGAPTRWTVNDSPKGLSVNAEHHVLATCDVERKIKEFSTHGKILREISLPDGVVNPWHAIQTSTGQFIVSHGGPGDSFRGVRVISADGRRVVHSHGGPRGSAIGQYNWPRHLALNDDFAFVVDCPNGRVTWLSPTLTYMRNGVSREQLKGRPDRLSIDVRRGRLYVADNEWKDGKSTAGRVLVCNV